MPVASNVAAVNCSNMNEHDTICPQIVIRVETTEVVPAVTAANILDEVARGFERYARAKGRRDLRLGVHRVDIGSLIINLIVVGRGPRLPRQDGLAQSFVSATGELFRIAQGSVPGMVKRMDARLVDALCRPVADGTASQLVMSSSDSAEGLTVDIGVARRVEQTRLRAVPFTREEAARSIPTVAVVPGKIPRLRELQGQEGTVLDVKGRLYVRLEGEDGVLNPLEPEPGVSVQDEGVYLFDGSWEGRRYRIRAAQRIA